MDAPHLITGTLKPERIAELLNPYLSVNAAILPKLYDQVALYLQLLLRWNAKTNLTAIREPEEIVRRHFGESLFAAQHVGQSATLLDLGSGAGFPGLPIQILVPQLHVTLAESQRKKASFLREVVRTLSLSTEVWAARAEQIPAQRMFDVVTLRAVDAMDTAIPVAASRARSKVILLSTTRYNLKIPDSFELEGMAPMPQSSSQTLLILRKVVAQGST